MTTQATNKNKTTPSPAAIGPTKRQLELQKKARERGGLTPSGLRKFATGSSGGGVKPTAQIVKEENNFKNF